jgi:hypothetical protein
MICRGLRFATLLVLASGVSDAQQSDSTAAPLPVFGTPVPAARAVLQAEPLAAEAPHRFLYDLGSTGFPHGVGAFGLRPEQQSLTLDGIPFDDVLTGRPRFDLLPLELLGAFGTEPAWGQPVGASAHLRPLPAPTARTELRYVTGQEGTQQIGATHAQDRRPGFVGEEGTLGLLAHVSGRDASGYYGASEVGGFRVLGRARLLRPRYSVEVVEMQQRQTAEARSGVSSFNPAAPVFGSDTRRETVRNDLWTTVRTQPARLGTVTATGFWTVQRDRYGSGEDPFPQRIGRGARLGGRFRYSLFLTGHRLSATLSGWRASTVDGPALTDSADESSIAFEVGDGFALGPLQLDARAGAVQHGGRTATTGALSVAWLRKGLSVSVSSGPLRPSRLERAGGFGISADGNPAYPRLSLAQATLERSFGTLDVSVGGYVSSQERLSAFAFDPALISATDSIAVLRDGSSLGRMGAEVSIGWRNQRPRGLYARLRLAAQSGSAETALGERLLAAMPSHWGDAGLGWRGTGLFNGMLDLDLMAGGRYWPAFQSLDFHAPSSLFALPAPGAALVPASGTLHASLTARVQRQASVFVLYQNVLGTRTTDGPYLVPIFPITPHQVSFGVFWTLLN